MIQFTLGLLNGFIFPLILGSSDKSPVIIYPKNGEGFSTFSNIEKTKLNPNGATVRQWETRAWITTIPLHKIINLKENPLISLTRFPDPIIASSSSEDHSAPGLTDLDETYKGYPRRYNSSKNQDRGESRESTDGKRKVSKSLPFHLETLNNSCYGEACRGNLFQGIYDSINHQKQLSSHEDYSTHRYHDQISQSKSPYHHSPDDNSDLDHYDEDDKKATHSKTNIAWSRLYPTEINTSHHKSHDGTTRTKDKDWKEKRNRIKIQSRKPVIDPLPNRDSFESSEESDHGHSSGPKIIPNLSVSLDDSRYSHHHLTPKTKDTNFKLNYPLKEYPPDHIDIWHSSEDPDHNEKSTKKRAHENNKLKSTKRKRTKKTYRHHHDDSIEEPHDDRDPNSGYGKIEKGSTYEPSNLSGHYSSHEFTDKEGNYQYKEDLPKSRKRQRCHCLTNYFDQPKHLNYDADGSRAA